MAITVRKINVASTKVGLIKDDTVGGVEDILWDDAVEALETRLAAATGDEAKALKIAIALMNAKTDDA